MATVLQIDRDRAKFAVECVTDSPPKARPSFADLWEDDLATAFAAHREQAAADLAEALRALERNTVGLYRGIAPGGNYGVNTVGSDKNESTFADADPVVVRARLALTKATTNE